MSTISVTNGSTILSLDSGTLHVTVEANGRRWQWAKDYTPVIRLKDGGEKKFSDAMENRRRRRHPLDLPRFPRRAGGNPVYF